MRGRALGDGDSAAGLTGPAADALTEHRVPVAWGGREPRVEGVELAAVRAIELTLSPLVPRLSFAPRTTLVYPAPLLTQGAALARLARRALANVA